MIPSRWKKLMQEILDGVQRELGSKVSAKAKVKLDSLRELLNHATTARKRKQFEQEVDSFVQGSRAVRAASERYIVKMGIPIIRAATAALKRAKLVFEKAKAK